MARCRLAIPFVSGPALAALVVGLLLQPARGRAQQQLSAPQPSAAPAATATPPAAGEVPPGSGPAVAPPSAPSAPSAPAAAGALPASYAPPSARPARPSNGIAAVAVGAGAIGIGALNLITLPVCTLPFYTENGGREVCLGLSVALGVGGLALGIPLLIVGRHKRRAYKRWREQYGLDRLRLHASVGGAGVGYASRW